MIDWLRLLLMIFYAPLRGMREARDRASLAPVALMAVLSQLAFDLVTRRFGAAPPFPRGRGFLSLLTEPAMPAFLIAIVIVPVLILIANTFERRGSFRVVLTQEYASVAASLFYVLTAANIFGIVMAAVFHYTGVQAEWVANSIQRADSIRAWFPDGQAVDQTVDGLKNPAVASFSLFAGWRVLPFCIGTVLAVRDVFRMSAARAFAVAFIAWFPCNLLFPIVSGLLSSVMGSPLLFFFVFMLLRGYFSDVMGSHRAKAAFRQNLESATLNPADASAHYNLGLIHQSRGELDAARERFERALKIDDGEVDASYQLGRIARQQKRYPHAIQHFEYVVARDPSHAQHEIWREVAATYIAAGQFEDARMALDQFLEHRPSDPEGLYLMGRAHAGLGHKREATSLMQACIEAVKTAPAYKYRASKRWLNEAQQFIKSSQ
jgi:tetratricopeptide (TPR) repeat protein